MIRRVPESRIKLLESVQFADLSIDRSGKEEISDRVIESAGIEIARKLAELHKVNIVEDGFRLRFHFMIEVIVP